MKTGSFLVGQMDFLGHFPKCPKMALNGPKLSQKWSKKEAESVQQVIRKSYQC